MLRQGKGPPLVLFHGVLCSENVWERVLPLVTPYHDVIALTALGHKGGNKTRQRPARFAHVIDDAMATLDELGLAKAHLAGNSMGGWVALELARRGRAESVCALSPAGCWTLEIAARGGPGDRLRAAIRQARFGRPFIPLLARSGRFRRWAMRLNAQYGDRLTAAEMVDRADDLLHCDVAEDLLGTDEALAPFASLPCPITLAWSEKDRVLPMRKNAELAKQLIPGARFVVLSDVGHVPMFDSPELVARTLLETTGARAS
jgi:pimeloyl-ACP methyl ester carboxylesterase